MININISTANLLGGDHVGVSGRVHAEFDDAIFGGLMARLVSMTRVHDAKRDGEITGIVTDNDINH